LPKPICLFLARFWSIRIRLPLESSPMIPISRILVIHRKSFFFSTMLGFFEHFEMMYVQYAHGVMDEETWNAWSTHIRMQFHQPGAQHWWSLRKEAFIPAFHEYLDKSTAPEMRSIIDLLKEPSVR
ncbi:MAG: hypothetical protein OEV41_04120, partial [Gammaproteobacteria bacterium]|nr:hypothetical protein [Gammaproteobacteria bacterium]